MLYAALMVLVLGVTAGLFNVTGVTAMADQIPWTLFFFGTVLLVVYVVRGDTVRDA